MAAATFSDLHEGRVRRKRADGPLRFRTSFHNTIFDAMTARGWKETESESDWDFHWADRDWVYDVFDNQHLESWQRVNHFRNARELCRKDLLARNLKRAKRQLEKDGKAKEAEDLDMIPATFVLPGDYSLFVEEFRRTSGSTVWIMKPVGKAQGRGIFLFTKLKEISQWKAEARWKPDNPQVETYVVQRYLHRPLLVGGKKFDCRIYALVTSFQPLQVWLYRSGFARFSASRYSTAAADVVNSMVHLTNVAIQKGNADYNKETGGKWSMRDFKVYMLSKYGVGRVDQVFKATEDIVINSLLAVQKIMINDKHCFELYGYDVMYDADLKPWLIEVNASPSLTANTPDDYDLKFKMLSDLMDVVDMENRRTGEETTIGGFDLIYDDGPVAARLPYAYRSMLGADFSRRVVQPPSAVPLEPRPPPAAATATAGAAAGAGGSASDKPGRRSAAGSATGAARSRGGSGPPAGGGGSRSRGRTTGR